MENQSKMEEMQVLDQKLNNLLMQKQAFQIELNETQSALEEITKSGEEVFKIVGQLMIKSDRTKVKEELSNKEKMLSLRLTTLEKQEDLLMKELEKFREGFMKK